MIMIDSRYPIRLRGMPPIYGEYVKMSELVADLRERSMDHGSNDRCWHEDALSDYADILDEYTYNPSLAVKEPEERRDEAHGE